MGYSRIAIYLVLRGDGTELYHEVVRHAKFLDMHFTISAVRNTGGQRGDDGCGPQPITYPPEKAGGVVGATPATNTDTTNCVSIGDAKEWRGSLDGVLIAGYL